MRIARRIAPALVGLATVALAACGGSNSNPLGQTSGAPSGSASSGGGTGTVVVGSANFTESQVLGEIYAQALKAKGVNSSTKANIGSREVYIRALKDKSISVVPEYSGNLLAFLDKNTKATTEQQIEQALPQAVGSDLKVLKASKATDQDVYVVTKSYSQQNGITSLEDLKKIAANATLGGPSELKERPYGPNGLKAKYGATFKQFKPYDSPAVKVRDLNDNKIQVATFFTTDAAIPDNGYVQLKDPKSMILPQNVLPLVRADVASNTTATSALEGVQAVLTTEDLTALNKKVDVDHEEASDVAGEWLKSKGLS